jgi:hypothetical protein
MSEGRRHTLEDRLAEAAERWRRQALVMPQGVVRDRLLRKVRHAELVLRMNGGLRSTALHPQDLPD